MCTANTPTSLLSHGKATGKDKAGKKIWTRIGAVWPNESGKGFNLTWEYLPLRDGVPVMLPSDTDRGETSPLVVKYELCAAVPPAQADFSMPCTSNCIFQ
jgi:hypothetical protein